MDTFGDVYIHDSHASADVPAPIVAAPVVELNQRKDLEIGNNAPTEGPSGQCELRREPAVISLLRVTYMYHAIVALPVSPSHISVVYY